MKNINILLFTTLAICSGTNPLYSMQVPANWQKMAKKTNEEKKAIKRAEKHEQLEWTKKLGKKQTNTETILRLLWQDKTDEAQKLIQTSKNINKQEVLWHCIKQRKHHSITKELLLSGVALWDTKKQRKISP